MDDDDLIAALAGGDDTALRELLTRHAPVRPPADRGAWIAACVVFAAGLIVFTVRGPRTRLTENG
jgi:hypothetical protein